MRNDLSVRQTYLQETDWRAREGLGTGANPQGMFPLPALTGGGRIPAQVLLGILTQESNLWQAEGGALPGQSSSPITGNFYGHDNTAPGQDSEHDLYVTLIDAAASGRVLMLGTGQIPARSRERFWLDNNLGHAFHVTLPDSQDIGVDRLVAIGTTDAGMDLSHLRQDLSFAQCRAFRDRDLGSVESKTPVEQYTSATADVWVRRP